VILTTLPQTVKIVEVGPRDGLQNEAREVPTEIKVQFVDALSAAGLREIEVTSFVDPRKVPQLADAEEVFQRISRRPGTVYSALVPNEQGLERALAAEVDRCAVFTAASETFNRYNINASIAESIERFRPVAAECRRLGLSLRGYISTGFVCPFEGPIAPERTVEVVRRLLDLGVEEISIGDTIGAAVPAQVDRLLTLLDPILPVERLALHCHDTRGTGLANVLLALQRGVGIFDSSSGGLGGCPYAPGATGNLATEDLCYFLEGMGVRTGVDPGELRRASTVVETYLGQPLPSRVRRAGPVLPEPRESSPDRP
jgi:hydroxymethylglutaryl-CoA lyase